MNEVGKTKASGMMTKQRRAVLDVIQTSDGHLTAREVFDHANSVLPGISFATVYNSLRYLKKCGLIGEITLETGASRYDRMTERHDHALCDLCGNLVDLNLAISEGLLDEAAKLSGFTPRTIELTLKGLCSDCTK